MKRDALLALLKQADGVEESAIGVLTQIISFNLNVQGNEGFSDQEIAEIRGHLDVLKEDSKKHKRLIQETRAYAEKGEVDDF